jgi:hypothetical protein
LGGDEGEGEKVFILSTLVLPHRRGRGLLERFEIFFVDLLMSIQLRTD